jgi:hypothetical protein
MKKTFIYIVSSILVILFATFLVISKHTPKPQDLIFDFKCLDTGKPCPIKIDESRKVGFEESINNAIKDSHRFGKLSDVYLSIMRFEVYLKNGTNAYLVIPATDITLKKPADIQCLERIFEHGAEIQIENNFVLTDSPKKLFEIAERFIGNCPGIPLDFNFTESELKGLPPIPPNTEIRFDVGPIFTPRFRVDVFTYFLVFSFNSLVFIGLLPLLREGWRFVTKGFSHYFNHSH